MNKYIIELKGIAMELVLGNYMPTDLTILNNWEEFYHYNDLIHSSQLLSDYLQELLVFSNNDLIYKEKSFKIPIIKEKSFCPYMIQNALYLRTECAENAVFNCSFEADEFLPENLAIHVQDYDGIFRTGNSFITSLSYNGKKMVPEWQTGTSIGNICVVCKFDQGYLIPEYDAINKTKSE
jgi:hypothetical protein